MTGGLFGELTALANAWTTASTWWVCSAVAGLGLAILLLRGAGVVRRLDGARSGAVWRGLVLGGALFVAALALRLLLPERVPYTFNDEYEYLDFARRLLASGEYLLWSGPPAGVYLYAVAFALFGASAGVAFAATIVLASLTPAVLCWTLRLLRVERAVAVVAALLLAVAPLHVKHAATASLEVASLLLLLLAIATFADLLRAPGALAALCFAISLFFALTVRVENWLLLLLLPLLAWPSRIVPRALRARHLLPALLAIALAAAYLPGILEAPIRYSLWWKSRLPAPALLATNLAFWVGGDLLQRKLPVAIALIGLVASVRRSRRAAVFWIAFAALYSLVFVLYGLNIGWLEEAHQPLPWGARGAGHDMFRFNVILLPAVVFLLASGIVALARGAAALLRGRGVVASWPRAARLGVLAGACVMLAALLLWRGEYGSYRPLAFIASRYNRGFEIAEFRFLQDALAGAPPGARCYVLPPAEGIVVDRITVRPLARLEADHSAGAEGAAFVYVNARQLAVPELRRGFVALQRRHALREVARAADGHDQFYLFALAPRPRPASAP